MAALLVLVVLADIVRSNLAVPLRIVLGLTGRRQVQSDLSDIPPDLRDLHGLLRSR